MRNAFKVPVVFDSTWKPIPEWPYRVSETGQVARDLAEKNTYIGKLLTPNKVNERRGNYLYYVLCRGGKTKTFYAHVLVATTFIGPKPSPLHQVRHLDGNVNNNHYTNLAWGTAKHNAGDREGHGHTAKGERSGMSVCSNEQVAALRQEYNAHVETRQNSGFTYAKRGFVTSMAKRENLNLITLRCVLANRGYQEKHETNQT